MDAENAESGAWSVSGGRAVAKVQDAASELHSVYLSGNGPPGSASRLGGDRVPGGGGQEINTGEAGIAEWLEVVRTTNPHWQVHLSSQLTDSEYGAPQAIAALAGRPGLHFDDDLHLAVSMRSLRAEHVSAAFVKRVLDHTFRSRVTSSALRVSQGLLTR